MRPARPRIRVTRSGYFAALIFLTACTSPATGVEVLPPVVMTVVVTASTAATPEAAATPGPTPPASSAAYPAPFQTSVTAVYQPFERGFMIYLSDRQAVWVFIRAIVDSAGTPVPTQALGQWLAFPDTFKEGEAETDPLIVAPAGVMQPKRGFGKIWRDHPEVRAALGWALNFERPYPTLVTDYSIGVFDSSGTYAPQSFIHTVFTLDGALIHVDEATHLWSQP